MPHSINSKEFEPIVESIAQQYPRADIRNIRSAVFRLQTACRDPRDLVGEGVLDLGCGSEKSKDHPGLIAWAASGFRRYDHCKPWFLRAVVAARGKGTGIDLAPNSNELFTAIQADLRDPTALGRKEFRSGMFRIVNNNMFTVPRGSMYRDLPFSPYLRGQVDGDIDALYAVNDNIQKQVERLLCEGGVYLVSERVYEKRNGALHLRES